MGGDCSLANSIQVRNMALRSAPFYAMGKHTSEPSIADLKKQIEANEAKERLAKKLAAIADRIIERLGSGRVLGSGNNIPVGGGARALPPGSNGRSGD